jgi:hypothetical protein
MARVLLTGANGDIRRLVPHLQAGHELRIGLGPTLREDMGSVALSPH